MTLYANRFNGKSAIVTGGASGLGLQVAARIVAEGGKVAIWDMNPEALAAAKKSSGAHYAHALDVSDYQSVVKAAQESNAALGKIDILVASAGITGATVPVSEFPIDSWLRVMDVNLNVASVAGKEGNPNASAYSASKAGVIGLTKSLGKELAAKGILVNCITPATFESAILAQLPQSQIDYMRSKIPMGRLGEAAESAALVCWLASEECSFSTGATFDISGGRTTY